MKAINQDFLRSYSGKKGADKVEKLYELREIEELLKVSNKTLLRYIKSGKLIATKIGGKWIVTEENLQKLIKGE